MYEDRIYENIKKDILEQVSMTDKREGSFVHDMISPVSYELEAVYAQFEKMLGIMFLDTSAGEYIDKRGAEYGIYRKEGQYAKGQCTFMGEQGTKIKTGTLCSTESGIIFAVTKEGAIAESGSVTLPIQAQETGDKYNVLAKQINRLPTEIFGVSEVFNAENILGGTERETDEELVERILLHLRLPATSGNKYHYRLWAMEVEGVGDARVFPLDNGAGTVTVMPITANGRSPGEEILQKVRIHIEEERPIGATVTVQAPTEVFLNIQASLQIAPSTTLAEVKKRYANRFQEYIRESVFHLDAVDYYKCLSMFYEIEGVVSVKTFLLNGKTDAVVIGKKEIQVAGNMDIQEVVS